MHDTGSSRSDAGQVSGRLTVPYLLFRARSSLLRTVSHAEKSHGPPAAVSAPSSDHAGHSVWRHNKNIYQLFRTMNIYRISAEGYAMYLFRVAARTQAAACMKLSVLLGIAAENCRVMETLPLNDHVREIESCRTRVSAR